MLTVAMTNNLVYAVPLESNATRADAMTGARLLIMEKCFDALIDTMIANGAVPEIAVVSMLDFLAERFAERDAERRGRS